jgi:hypothetical protein
VPLDFAQWPLTDYGPFGPPAILGTYAAFSFLKPSLHEKERCLCLAFVLISKTLIRLPPHSFRLGGKDQITRGNRLIASGLCEHAPEIDQAARSCGFDK